jgi:dihydroxy-acid dehydratase
MTAVGGPIALIEEGDIVSVDIDAGLTSDPGDVCRAPRGSPPAPRYTTGALAKYAALVSSASEGAITSGARLRSALASAPNG